VEGGEGHALFDESLQVAVARAEATQEVQHQGTIGNWLTEVAERVSQALHLAAVFSHGEVPLREQVEPGVEVERPRIPIPEELILESEPRLARSVRLIADDVLELNGDGVVEPREDNVVHEAPGARRRSVVVDEDVVVEDEPPQREKDLSSPTGVVGRRQIQHHGHESPDVVQTCGLGVESSDEVDVEVRGEGVLRGFHRGDRRAAEEALCGGHLGGQSGTQGTLTLQGEGGGALTLPRGHHSRLDRSEGVAECGVSTGGCREGRKPRWRASTMGRGRDVAEGPEADDVGSLGICHGATGAHGVGLAGSREAQGGDAGGQGSRGRAQTRGQGQVRQAGGVRVRGEVRHGSEGAAAGSRGLRAGWGATGRGGEAASRGGLAAAGTGGAGGTGRARIRRVEETAQVHVGVGGRGRGEVGSREDGGRGGRERVRRERGGRAQAVEGPRRVAVAERWRRHRRLGGGAGELRRLGREGGGGEAGAWGAGGGRKAGGWGPTAAAGLGEAPGGCSCCWTRPKPKPNLIPCWNTNPCP
jgi:hypothetical protein